MSAAAPAVPVNTGWPFWRSQTLAIVRMELRKNFITKRGFWIYLLAAAPAVIVTLHSIVTMQRPVRSNHDIAMDTKMMAILFQFFFLRPALFFGCVGIFTYLFRGEVVERSLHYYFLAPVRREVLAAAKFIAGAVTAICFFGASILLTFVGMYLHFSNFQIREFLLNGPGLGQLGAYAGITVLACLGWGSVFLWMGIRFRNPVVPAVVFFAWETINVFLPSWLRRLSVLHYLQSLTPVQTEARGPGVLFGSTAAPENAVVAALAVLGITVVMLLVSVRQLKRSEISYSTD